jgi:hypothetical protein
LYLAETPAVAGSYIQAGRNVGFENWDDPIRLANKAFGNAAGDIQKATLLLDDAIAAAKPGSRKNNLIFAKQALERGDQTAGLYKVDLPDDKIARMLDWDKPLSQQALNVQQALGPKVVQRNGGWYVDSGAKQGDWKFATEAEAASEARQAAMSRDVTGSVLHDRLKIGADAETAQLLRQLGIPGIRYLDGGSRGTGAGTSNFVVFPGEENALRILERNGLLVP